MLYDVFKGCRKALEKVTIEWESAKTVVEDLVAVSFGYKVLGWRSIPAYNFVIVRAFLFWVQDSLDEKCEVLLHPNGLSEDGTTTL
ncbi:hypothetical protein Tco_0884624 [Tanacetum coccineum]